MIRQIALAIVITCLLGTGSASAGHGGAWLFVGDWEMNEPRRADTLHDGTGNYPGHIGMTVTPTNRAYHHFPRVPKQAYVPSHVDRVPDDDHLDPSFSAFGVAVRFRWSVDRHDMNLVQKGQGSPAGGMFKMKTTVPAAGQPRGHVKCLFRGETADSQVESYAGPRLDDGKWHTVLCTRTDAGTRMVVDGVLTDRNDKDPGSISNSWPVAIGGNTYCRKAGLQCNYWVGDIGFVRWLDRG